MRKSLAARPRRPYLLRERAFTGNGPVLARFFANVNRRIRRRRISLVLTHSRAVARGTRSGPLFIPRAACRYSDDVIPSPLPNDPAISRAGSFIVEGMTLPRRVTGLGVFHPPRCLGHRLLSEASIGRGPQ